MSSPCCSQQLIYANAGCGVSLSGGGTQTDPFVISSQVASGGGLTCTTGTGLSIQIDPAGGLSIGANGLGVATAAAFTVSTSAPIQGDGSATDQVRLQYNQGLELAADAQTLQTKIDDDTINFNASGQMAVTLTTGAGITGTGATGSPLNVQVSSTANNLATVDANGVFVPPTYVQASQSVAVAGSGTLADPYIPSIDLSTDANNSAVFGTDGGLFVPTVPGVGTDATNILTTDGSGNFQVLTEAVQDAAGAMATASNGLTYNDAADQLAVAISATADNIATLAADGVYVQAPLQNFQMGMPGTLFVEAGGLANQEKWYAVGGTVTIADGMASLGTVADADVNVLVGVNGATVATWTISAGNVAAAIPGALVGQTINAGSYLSVLVSTVGSATNEGTDLNVQFGYRLT